MSNITTRKRVYTPTPKRVGRTIALMLMAMITALVITTVGPTPAQAAPASSVAVSAPPAAAPSLTVRPGAGFGQIDVLLDGWDMQRVVAGGNFASGYWASAVLCWQAGVVGGVLGLTTCQTMITVCAFRAAAHHRWGGMTFTPWGNYWCWEY